MTASVCPQCKSPKLPHRACPKCGTYKGREVIVLELIDRRRRGQTVGCAKKKKKKGEGLSKANLAAGRTC